MSRFSIHIVGITMWSLTILLLMANTAFPEIPLIASGITLGVSLSLAAWVIFVMAGSASPVVRASQGAYFCVPLVWALWVANSFDLTLNFSSWVYLVTVCGLALGVQEIALLERSEEQTEPVSKDLLEAVRPILSPPAALDTGSMRIPR